MCFLRTALRIIYCMTKIACDDGPQPNSILCLCSPFLYPSKKGIHACVRLCFLLSPHVSSPVGDIKCSRTAEGAKDEANFLKRGLLLLEGEEKVPRSSRFPSCQAPVSCPLHPLFILTQLSLLKKRDEMRSPKTGKDRIKPFCVGGSEQCEEYK